MKTPHWPLDRVKELAAKPNGLFVQVGRAAKFFPTRKEALDSARLVIASLTSGQFAHSVQLTFDTADVYGVSFNDGGWYLKLTIDESIPEVAVISLHPLEQPLQTNKGVVKP